MAVLDSTVVLGRLQVSAVSIFFESLPYRVDETTGLIDYDMLDKCDSGRGQGGAQKCH